MVPSGCQSCFFALFLENIPATNHKILAMRLMWRIVYFISRNMLGRVLTLHLTLGFKHLRTRLRLIRACLPDEACLCANVLRVKDFE